MKNYTQVYVKNSLEAANFYCKAFGAEITRAFPNADGTAYEHCELSVNGEGFLALAEAANPCDVAFLHKMKWETMTFNVFEMGSEAAVQHAFAGIRVCVCVLIFNAVTKLWKKAVTDKASLVLCLLVFVLSAFLDLSPVLFVVLCAAAGIFFTKVGLRGK